VFILSGRPSYSHTAYVTQQYNIDVYKSGTGGKGRISGNIPL